MMGTSEVQLEKAICPDRGVLELQVFPEALKISDRDLCHCAAVNGPWILLFVQEPGRFVPMAQTVEAICNRTTVQAFDRVLQMMREILGEGGGDEWVGGGRECGGLWIGAELVMVRFSQ